MPRSRPIELTELMDQPEVNPTDLAQALRFIRKVNRYLGGTRAVLCHLQQWEPLWPHDRPIRVLDVATGSGDIPQAIVAWARHIGRRIDVVGLDLHPTTLGIARRWVGSDPDIQLVQGDALALPLEDRSVDIATCSMFLHHLDGLQALQVLREMLRISRHGVIVNDLLRHTWAKVAIRLLTVFSSPIDRHDARVSVAKGWIRKEIERWPAAVGAPWLQYHAHAFARFTLAGHR
jgi:ubiquinone/menaquinone biosynthesis C-methylase UbiE